MSKHQQPNYFGLTDRDYGLLILDNLDVEAQLIAIRNLLARNITSDEETTAEIEKLKQDIKSASGSTADHLLNDLVDELHQSVFQDAAHSMAAAGMLAPLVESYFTSVFPAIAQRMELDPDSVKFAVRAGCDVNQFWDPHYVVKSNVSMRNIAEGIPQLAECLGLQKFFPKTFNSVFSALFAYRNKQFHHGFEWPLQERLNFTARAKSEGWPDAWFSNSTSGGNPWIIYMTRAFVDLCLNTFESCIVGIGKFVKDT